MVSVKKIILDTMINFHLKKIKQLEDDVFKSNHTHKASESSPARFNKIFTSPILFANGKPISIKISSLLFLNSFFNDIRQSMEFSDINFSAPTKMKDGFFRKLVSYQKHLKINSLSYSYVPREFIYKDMAIPHKNAIVLALEMDNKKELGIELVRKGNFQILQAYQNLWCKTFELAKFLRDNGYSAYPGHPFLGAVSYISLAKAAGLGWVEQTNC